ncbi:hypothetical protein GALL_342940 [mine drainage metagenome]|uniref:Uncharacterized protein n=1 Tax=mine drainage metagenome TaxID=410659 RepID=A0A1J5R6W8_9ZZZZ
MQLASDAAPQVSSPDRASEAASALSSSPFFSRFPQVPSQSDIATSSAVKAAMAVRAGGGAGAGCCGAHYFLAAAGPNS